MADILLYNAFNENQKLLTRYFLQAVKTTTDPIPVSSCLVQSTAGIILPQLMTPITGCIKVWDGTSTYSGGAAGTCCLWTVPSGVTEAEFQIWGAGSPGSATSTCCALGSHGGDGSYIYVRIQVAAAQTYTLCAGGANCCGGAFCAGCNSFVCGSNSTTIVSCGAMTNDCCYPGLITTPKVVTLGASCNYDCNVTYAYETYSSSCAGSITSNNNIINYASVRARKGGWYATCSCCYLSSLSASHINADHTVTKCFHGAFCDCGYDLFGGPQSTGCIAQLNGLDRGPGFAGLGTHNRAYCWPYFGGSGNTGQVIVRYR